LVLLRRPVFGNGAWQGVEVRRFELRDCTPLEDLVNHRRDRLQPFQRPLIRAVAERRLPRLRQSKLAEEHVAQRLWAADIELVPDLLVDGFLGAVDLHHHRLREFAQHFDIDRDSHALHLVEHRHQRQFHVAIERCLASLLQLLLELGTKAEQQVGILAGR
jgi:hypothetical protein